MKPVPGALPVLVYILYAKCINMKKILFYSFVMISAPASLPAQQLPAAKVPVAVKEAFVKLYAGITPKWEKEQGLFEASFKQNGQSLSVLFNNAGTVTESELDILVTELPAAIPAYIKEHYKGIAIKDAAKITKPGGRTEYEAGISKMDLVFDANGKFLKEVKD